MAILTPKDLTSGTPTDSDYLMFGTSTVKKVAVSDFVDVVKGKVVGYVSVPISNLTFTNTITKDIDISSYIPSGNKILALIPEQSGSNNIYFYSCLKSGDKKITIQLKCTISGSVTVNIRVGVLTTEA